MDKKPGRTPLWTNFTRLVGISGYQYRKIDAAIRDKSRNVLPEHWDGEQFQVAIKLDNGNRLHVSKKELMAYEFLGAAPRFRCCVCGYGNAVRQTPKQLNGDPADCTAGNLKYVEDTEAQRRHEFQCLSMLMSQRPHSPGTFRKRTPDLYG